MTVQAGIVAAQDHGQASCSERRRPLFLSLSAEATLRITVHQSANRFSYTGRVGVAAMLRLDFAKNPLGWRVEVRTCGSSKTPLWGAKDYRALCGNRGICRAGWGWVL
jgi:hypothetical protein